MQQFTKWPLAVAVASTILLGGCLGGGGGGGSDGDGGAAGGGTTTRYSLTVGTAAAAPVASLSQSPAERIASAVVDFLITPAMAEVFSDLDPSTFRVFNINADGSTEELVNGEDFTAETDGDGYTLELPFATRYSSYVEIPVSGTLSYQVPTTRADLVANPLTTFVTQQIANRVGQFDELTLEEVDQIIEAVIELANDPQLQADLDAAVNGGASTEELLAEVDAKLSATITAQLDDKATPELTGSQASAASGSYYNTALSIGGFSDLSAGLLLGGWTVNEASIEVANGTANYSVPALTDFNFEVINSLGVYAGVSSRAEVDDEADSGTFNADSNGFTFAEEEEFLPYEKGSDSVPACETLSAECTDREYSAGTRATAAGPASAPFNTLIDTGFSTRDVRDADNNQLLQVFGGDLGVFIKKSSSTPTLNGQYGAVEMSVNGESQYMDVEVYTTELTFDQATKVDYCEKHRRELGVNLSNLDSSFAVRHFDTCVEAADDNPLVGEAGENPVVLGSDGALDIDLDLTGWLSPDGLTLVTSLEEPNNLDALLDAEETLLQANQGFRQFLMAVKTASNADLSGNRYRLVSIALLSEDGAAVEPHRLNAGYLEFDDQGQATLSAAWQWQNIGVDGFGEASLNDQLNLSFSSNGVTVDAQTGALTLSTVAEIGSETVEFNNDGYVQEGERLIILGYDAQTSGGFDADMLGVLVGVCTNCDQ